MDENKWWNRAIGIIAITGISFVIVGLQTKTNTQTSNSIPTISITSTSSVQKAFEVSTTRQNVDISNATITRVVDGDTVIAAIDGEAGEQKIRLLGINTPETVDPRKPVECFGREASNYAKKLLTGLRVLLVADPEADETDKYNRLLRNLYLPDGREYNKMMVSEGYAYAYLSFPLNAKHKRDLKNAESEARTAKRGLWSLSTCDGNK